MKWFKEVNSLDELRKLYRKLVVKYHPDNGGSEELIKEINNEYESIFKRLKEGYQHSESYRNATERQKQTYDWQKDKQIRDMVMQLSKFKDIKVEIIGTWIWLSNCYAYRKELKELGFHWASKKQMWYIHFDDFHKFNSKPVPMSYIRERYGSTEVKFSTEKDKKERLSQA